jgi:hypothetical protein
MRVSETLIVKSLARRERRRIMFKIIFFCIFISSVQNINCQIQVKIISKYYNNLGLGELLLNMDSVYIDDTTNLNNLIINNSLKANIRLSIGYLEKYSLLSTAEITSLINYLNNQRSFDLMFKNRVDSNYSENNHIVNKKILYKVQRLPINFLKELGLKKYYKLVNYPNESYFYYVRDFDEQGKLTQVMLNEDIIYERDKYNK